MSLSQGFASTFSDTQQTQEVLQNHENELKKIYNDINSFMASNGHSHTGSGTDGALIDIASINSSITALNGQYDTGTLFIPAGVTFSPPIRAGRNRTYNKIYVDCIDNTGVAQNPTSLTVSIYQNGTSVYTSSAITTAAANATINLTIASGDLIRVVVNNTTGLTGGVSVTLRQVNR